MNDDQGQTSADNAELEREIRRGRTFSLAEAIGRLAGPGTMKGASPITRARQAEAVIDEHLNRHLDDSSGALRRVLLRQVTDGKALLDRPDRPLTVLADHLRLVLASDTMLKELVRETDMEWGRMFDERPHFERDGCAPDPDDPYTLDSVRLALERFLGKPDPDDQPR